LNGVVESSTILGRAMAVGNWHKRQEALRACCDDALDDPTGQNCRAFVRELVDLAVSLDGLPPSTFDVFRQLRDRPQLAPYLLFFAGPGELEQVLRLADGLPFAWYLVPRRFWYEAASAQADYLFARVPDEHALVASAIREAREAIAAFDPVLAPLLVLEAPPETLDGAANDFLVRSVDRIEGGRWSPFRPARQDLLPQWTYLERYWRALDAPIAAALAALEIIDLDEAEIACVKDVARRHPRWFREGFAAKIREK
jgi:hypothetical protein